MQNPLRQIWAMTLLLALSLKAAGQNGDLKKAIIQGRLINDANGQPVAEMQVAIPYLRLLTTTDGEGVFSFSQVLYGEYQVVTGGWNSITDTFRISVNAAVVKLQPFSTTSVEQPTSQSAVDIPIIALEESDLTADDDGTSVQPVGGLLTASRDPFLNTASYVLNAYRFQARGYDRSQQQVLINGLPMNDVETGAASWSDWGGLNDVFRSRSMTYGLQSSEYTFGGLLGAVCFDATAFRQRKQTRLTYAQTNRQYRSRLALTHSTGMLRSGWAFSASASRRWANDGYVAGTFYDVWSYYLAASKQIGNRGTLSLTTFGTPGRRGKASSAIREGFELSGSRYWNPAWGFQNGEVRNAKVASSFQPVALLSYEYNVTNKTRWNTALSYQFGSTGNSTLDWYSAADPRADYYRNFPGWYASQGNLNAAEVQRAALSANPDYWMQVKWDDLIQANQLNRRAMVNPDGSFSEDSGLRSVYVLANDVSRIRKWVFGTNLETVITDHLTVSGGISWLRQRTERYRQLIDLLGGDYFININQFAERSYPGSASQMQNDVNHPFGIVRNGDKYFYHYINHFNRVMGFGQANFTFNKTEFFLAAQASHHSFDREGLYRNGLFPNGNESLGKSKLQKFMLYGIKGGIIYKVNGRHYLFLNAALQSDAPAVENTFISPRLRNKTVDDPAIQRSYSAEGGYLLRTPKASARAVGYATDILGRTEIKRFFNEDDGANTFVNYAMRRMNQRFIGTELALDLKLSSSVGITAVAALGQAFYTNAPEISIYKDGDTAKEVGTKNIYIKNFYLAAGPQSAYTLGLNYRSKQYWYSTVNFSYLDRNYVAIAADRRSQEAVDLVAAGSQQWHQTLDQEKLPTVFIIDLVAGKSIRLSKCYKKLPRTTTLYINAGISNLLDNRKIINSGAEQLRFNYADRTASTFPTKYLYGFGRNFSISLSLKF